MPIRLLVLSDLHLNFGARLVLPSDGGYDAVILAGDIHAPGRKAVQWAKRQTAFENRPVILVPGNHEFYGVEMRSELAAMRREAAGSNVEVLDMDVLEVGGVRILGATLWTDFAVTGEGRVDRAMDHARRRIGDFRHIRLAKSANGAFEAPFAPEDALEIHFDHRGWLARELASARADGVPTVVVTHHAPHARSISPAYANDVLTPSFVSHLPDDYFAWPSLWIHGHTHASSDYLVGGCRIMCNPRGYALGEHAPENQAFRNDFVVTLDPQAGTVASDTH